MSLEYKIYFPKLRFNLLSLFSFTLLIVVSTFFPLEKSLAAEGGCRCNNETACPSQTFIGATMPAVEARCTNYCNTECAGEDVREFIPYWPCQCCDDTDLGTRSETSCRRECGSHDGTAQTGDPSGIPISDCPGGGGPPPSAPGCYCDGVLRETACTTDADCSEDCPLSRRVVCVPGYTRITASPGCYCRGILTREMACATAENCRSVCNPATPATEIMCVPGYTPPSGEPARAARGDNPAYKPQCWSREQCEQSCGLEQGCYWEDTSKHPDCAGGSGDWGKCFPKTEPVPLKIPIGGIQQVNDVTEYIAAIYKYAISIGGILAGIMIMIGGLLYLTAGGSPERVSNAKNYISNALVGLVLLLTSYLLLQTISPKLVEFAKFKIFLIRPQRLVSQFCEDLQSPTGGLPPLKFAQATRPGSTDVKPFSEIQQADYNKTDFSELRCGTPFYEQSSGDATCLGKSCKYSTDKPACIPYGGKWDCLHVALAGKLKSQREIDQIRLVRVFPDGSNPSPSWTPATNSVVTNDFFYIGLFQPDFVDAGLAGYQINIILKDTGTGLPILGGLGSVDDPCVLDPNDCELRDEFHTGLLQSDTITTAGQATIWKKEVFWTGKPTAVCNLTINENTCAD